MIYAEFRIQMIQQSYSQHSFYPFSRQLKPTGPLTRLDLLIRANRVNEKINNYFDQSPLHKLNPDSFRVGIYGELGRGSHTEFLLRDLQSFLKEFEKHLL